MRWALLSLVALPLGGRPAQAREALPRLFPGTWVRPHIVVVVDSSESMGRARGAASRLSLAKRALHGVLTELGKAANVDTFTAPTAQALAAARRHFAGLDKGDAQAESRSRFVLVVSDGAARPTTAAKREVVALFELHGARTIGVAVLGTSARGRAELDALTDCGDDGDCRDRSAKSLSVAPDAKLIDALRAIVFRASRGDYATAPAGVMSAHGVAADVSLMASVRFPGWQGRLQATDLTREPTRTLWEAGALLSARIFSDRKIYSGRPSFDAGKLVRVYDGHAINEAMRTLWPPSAGAAPADLKQAIAWALGRHRRWKLPPIVHAVPAVVGPPPSPRGRADRAAFAARHATRQRLIYVPSNEGILHAFDARSGREVWGFLAPHLLPKLYALYRAGGQSADPSKFVYVLASSPKVADVKIDGAWKTVLVQSDGPGGEGLVVLDITEMPRCGPTCQGAPAPRILFEAAARVAHGEPGWPPAISCAGSCSVDALVQGLVASTVVLVDPATKKVVRTYRRAGHGLVARARGDRRRERPVIDLGQRSSVDFAPAVMLHERGKNYLALASQSAFVRKDAAVSRLQIYLDDGQKSPLGAAETLVDCRVSDICHCLGADPGVICISPSARAKPIGSPLLVRQEKGNAEASFVYFDPPAYAGCRHDADCASGERCQAGLCRTPCAVATVQRDCSAGLTCRAGLCAGAPRGDSYVFRIALDGSTQPPSARLRGATKFVGVQAAGLTVIGGATVALTASGRAATPAGLRALGSSSLASSLASLGRAAIESWREIR